MGLAVDVVATIVGCAHVAAAIGQDIVAHVLDRRQPHLRFRESFAYACRNEI